MNWEERVNEGPTPQQMQDQITVLQSQLRASDEENRRLRSLGDTDVKEMVERAITKFEAALEVIKQALKLEERDERRADAGKSEKVRKKSTDRVRQGRQASGDNTGEVSTVRGVSGGAGLPASADRLGADENNTLPGVRSA